MAKRASQDGLASAKEGGRMSSDSVAFIDIGSAHIQTILATVNDETACIHGVGCVPSRGVRNGVVVEVEDATNAIEASVREAQGTGDTKVRQAVVGFSGRHISSVNPATAVETDRRHRVVTESVLREAEKEIRSIALPEDRLKVNIVARQYDLDRLQGIKNPLGMRGFRLDLEAHVVTAETASVENLALCVRRAGLPVAAGSLVANPLACGEAVLDPEDREAGVILADIGAGTTGVAVFKDGSIWQTFAIPVGGRHVTSDLAAGLNISFSAAEELKVNCGSVHPDAECTNTEMMAQYGTSAEEVGYLISARMEELLRMITSKASYLPDTLVLTGGGAKLPGMEQFAGEVLGLRARVGSPRMLPEGAAELNDPASAAAVGLLLWGTAATSIQEDMNGAEENGSDVDFLLKPIIAGFSGLRDGWQTLWCRRPRIVFGSVETPEDEQS
jgi:cell division protein FtsA